MLSDHSELFEEEVIIVVGNNASGVEIEGADAMRVTDEYPGAGKGVLEMMRDPWDPEKAMLLVAGSDECGVKAGEIELLVNNTNSGDKVLLVTDINLNPENVSPILYRFYLDNIIRGIESENVGSGTVDLSNMICILKTTRKLTPAERNELESKGIAIRDYWYYECPRYTIEVSITILPDIARYSFVECIEPFIGNPILEGEVVQ